MVLGYIFGDFFSQTHPVTLAVKYLEDSSAAGNSKTDFPVAVCESFEPVYEGGD
jgi:hypothetical protein